VNLRICDESRDLGKLIPQTRNSRILSETETESVVCVQMSAVPITGQLLGSFKPSKRFSSKHGTRITSVDFDDTGEWCVTAGDDETIQLYDCKRGKYVVFLCYVLIVDIQRLYTLRNTGSILRGLLIIHRMLFTHQQRRMVYFTLCEADVDTLRYLSLHDNHYVRYFKGHKKQVVSLELSPTDDQLLSAGLDDTVRLWNLNSASCQVPPPFTRLPDVRGV